MSETQAQTTLESGAAKEDAKPIESAAAPLSRSESLKRPAEPEFVLVKELVSGEIMELPTLESDNTLGLTTLTHAFPGAHGLKYKTETGTTRALLIDSTGSKFYLPTTGWAGKTFTVIFNNTPSAVNASQVSETKIRPSSDQTAKRKKIMDDNESSDSEQGGENGHYGYGAKQKRMEAAVKIKEDKEDDNNHPTDLIVLGLPFKLTENDLKDYFGQFGSMKLCEIKKDNSGNSKGFGFIQFETFESQLRVLTRPVHSIGGRRCEVKVPHSKKGDVRSEFGGIEHAKLFIGRLQEKTSENSLKDFFLTEAKKIDPKATIIDTFIPKPFRSFAFITFSSPKIVRELIKKGDFIIDGSSVSVSSAAPKTTETSPGMSSNYSNYGHDRPSYNDFALHDWMRSPIQAPTSRFNDQAFVRPFERKRTFETAYGGMEPNYGTPGMMQPPQSMGGSQALASGFETLNLNQLPTNEMMNAFSHFISSTQNARSSPMPPPSQIPRYHNQQQPSSLHMRGRHDHGPPGSGRGGMSRSQYGSPYSRGDDSYY